MSFARPGCCPICGVFVSVRTKHAYRCRPQDVPSDLLAWSGRSPMLLWPRTHLVQQKGGTFVRSPVEGVGPRLLVLLAQHRSHARRDLPGGKRARYGPSHALHDLVQLPPEEVLDQVQRPAPAWVPCEGTWHRLLLWHGSLWPMDHGDVDMEAEQVAAALTGQRLTGCPAAVALWPGRRRALRVPWLESLARLDAAASWGVDELAARDCWIDERVDRRHVDDAQRFGVSDVELLRWTSWERSVARIAGWRALGWTARESEHLQAVGLTPFSSAPWRAAGLDVGLIHDALEHELEPADAGEWWRAGFAPQAAAQLDFCGFDLAEARTLKAELGKVDVVLAHALTVASR